MQLIENKPVVVQDGSFVANGPASHLINTGNPSHCPRRRIASPSASSVHLRVVSCLGQVLHLLRSLFDTCLSGSLRHLEVGTRSPWCPGGRYQQPPRVVLIGSIWRALALSLANIVPAGKGTGNWIRPRFAGEPQLQRTTDVANVFRLRAAVSFLHCSIETLLEDHSVEISYRHQRFLSKSSITQGSGTRLTRYSGVRFRVILRLPSGSTKALGSVWADLGRSVRFGDCEGRLDPVRKSGCSLAHIQLSRD